MDWKDTARKYWWVGAIVLALLFVFRPRQSAGSSTVARLSAVEGATPTSDGILNQTVDRLAKEEAERYGRMASAQEKLAMQGMEQQGKLLQAQAGYQLSVLQGQTVVQDKLTQQAKSAKFACPDGKAKIHPATGELYCRTKKGGGLTLGNLVKRSIDFIYQYAPTMIGAPPAGTPPIVPWEQNEGRGAF